MRSAPALLLSPWDRSALYQVLSSGARSRTSALVVLHCADGKSNKQIAEELGVSPKTAARWRARFVAEGAPGLTRDLPRPGRPTALSEQQRGFIVAKKAKLSTRSIARIVGVSASTVQRVTLASKARA